MSNNCLITKLKASSSNENLPFYGGIVFTLQAMSNSYCSLISTVGSTCKLYVLEGNFNATIQGDGSKVSNSEYIIPHIGSHEYPGFNITCDAGTKIVITNKYNLTTFVINNRGASFDIDGLSNSIYLKAVQCGTNNNYKATGSLGNIENLPELSNFSVTFSNLLTGDIASLAGFTNLATISIRNDTVLTGNVSDLSSLTNLKNLNLAVCRGVSGTMEAFVKDQCATRVSGTINVTIEDSSVTFRGSTPTGSRYFDFTSDGCNVYSDSEKTTLVASYNKSTDTWS